MAKQGALKDPGSVHADVQSSPIRHRLGNFYVHIHSCNPVLQMLDRISEVQMAHNRSKTAAMHELLDKGIDDRTDQASTIAETCTEELLDM